MRESGGLIVPSSSARESEKGKAERKEKRRTDTDGGWDACACECAASATGPGESLDDDVAAVLEDAKMLSLRCDTASHSLVPTLVLVSARAGPSRRPTAGACSLRSRARRSSHRARSASARVRTSALCLRHSTTCASYEALQASCSEAETETEEDDREEGASSGDVAPGAVAAAGSDGGCDSGCEGETRERSGGTEKGSESAACVGCEFCLFVHGRYIGYCELTWRRSSASGCNGLVSWSDISYITTASWGCVVVGVVDVDEPMGVNKNKLTFSGAELGPSQSTSNAANCEMRLIFDPVPVHDCIVEQQHYTRTLSTPFVHVVL